MNKKNIFKILKIFSFLVITAFCIAILIYLFPLIKGLMTKEGQILFKEKIDSFGNFGFVILFLIEFAQVFFFILPGEPIEIFAGMCYGGIGGTIFILVSVFIITSIIFFAVRKFGLKLIYEFFNKNKVKKIIDNPIFKDSKKINFIMIILFLIPGTPKDLFIFIGALLPIKPLNFILISTFARLPSVISSTLAGANIVQGNLKIGIILYAIIFVAVAIAIFIVRKFDKQKITDKAISALK